MKLMQSTITIIPNLKKKKFLGLTSETYTLVVTKKETIFAKLTSNMLKEIVLSAKKDAKSEGKGFFGRWGAQISASIKYFEKYNKMSLDDIKNETEGNFSIKNDSISKVKVITIEQNENARIFYEILIKTSGEKYKFITEQDVHNEFKKAYGSKMA